MALRDLFDGDIQAIIAALEEELPLLSGKTVVLTGGAGFLGTYITGTLLAANRSGQLAEPCSVVILDNHITGVKGNRLMDFDDPQLKFVEHDVKNPVPDELHADYIIHAAGIASPVYYRKYPLETIDVAVTGTRNMLDFAQRQKVAGMLFFSSSEVYGDPHPNYVPTPETYWGNVSQVGPRACYDESKRLGETLCAVYHQLHETPIKVVRPFNVYGPGMRTDDYRVVPMFLTKAILGEELAVHGHGNQTRTFCYIADAIQGFLKVLLKGRPGEAYNIGNDDEEINMMALANTVSEIFSHSLIVHQVDYPEAYPAGEPQRRCPDLTKSKTELGYRPSVDLRSGLGRTLAWYRELMTPAAEEK